MSGPRTQPWDFGNDDDKEITQSDLSREVLIEKTREATRKVGYSGILAEEPKRRATRPKHPKKQIIPAIGRPRGARTNALATKITAEQDALLKAIASDGLVIADIVSEAMKALARQLIETGRYKRLHLDADTLAKARAVLASEK